MHLQKLPKGVVYRKQWNFGLTAEMCGNSREPWATVISRHAANTQLEMGKYLAVEHVQRIQLDSIQVSLIQSYLEQTNGLQGSTLVLAPLPHAQGLSRNASSVSFGHAEHCFLTVWTPKSLCPNLLKKTFLRR